jgi:hypothetical protein
MPILSIILSVVASCVLGFWWYSNAGFAKPWIKMMGIDPKKMKEHNKNMGATYSLMMGGSLIGAFVFNMLLNAAGITDIHSAVRFGFWLWLGFVFTTQLNSHLFSGRKFQPALLAIDSGYQLVSLGIMAVILTLL